MAESQSHLEHVSPRRGRGLPPVAASAAAIAIATFLIGFALAGRLAPGRSPSLSLSPPPAFSTAVVSSELRTAYAKVVPAGWVLCQLAVPAQCEPIDPAWQQKVDGYGSKPLVGSGVGWEELAKSAGPSPRPFGHFVLAGPITLVGAQAALARVDATGQGILAGVGQTVIEGVLWADLGTLDAGRYVAVVTGWSLEAGASSGPGSGPSGSVAPSAPDESDGFALVEPTIAVPIGQILAFAVGP